MADLLVKLYDFKMPEEASAPKGIRIFRPMTPDRKFVTDFVRENFGRQWASECETAAGILLAAFDRIPEEGDTVSFTGRDAKATFTVADMDRHRVDKILVRVEQIPREDAEE